MENNLLTEDKSNIFDHYFALENNLFQSVFWQSFHESQGNKCFLINGEDYGLMVKAQATTKASYLYCPKGPATNRIKSLESFLLKAIEIGKKNDCLFLRIEPNPLMPINANKLGLKEVDSNSVLSRQHSPENTLLLDLEETETELLESMKPKTRYNIRLALKRGIEIRESISTDDLEFFYKLSVGLKKRGYTPFDYLHYYNLFTTLSKEGLAKMFVAEHQNEILSIMIVTYFGKTATYLHSASSDNKRELKPNHLAMWTAILDAKKRGFKIFDFWGIAPNDDPNHKWAGITSFKKGFGGTQINSMVAYDYPIKKNLYKIYSKANKAKKIIKK
jgi:lipid II:glycine glycyltransferase (peptidoglycan interpeptide bridge formation enzyme)